MILKKKVSGFLLIIVLLCVTLAAGFSVLRASPGEARALEGIYPATTQVSLAESYIYVPLILKNFPFIPETPVLNAINNSDGDGSYTVSWSASAEALDYVLEEDDNSSFSSPITVYSGPDSSIIISSQDLGMYYYRVNAVNSYASSDWSNIESVMVTVSLPPCLQIGMWYGATSQGYPISFEVENLPQCQIVLGSLKATFKTNCDTTTTQIVTIMASPAITNDHFNTGNIDDHQVIGDFSSSSMASGMYDFNPTASCHASGTWEATTHGANDAVSALALQPDGKILVGGRFTALGGQPHAKIGRLNADGTLDTSFNPAGANNDITALAVQTDGKILIGGNFTEVNGEPRERIARLNADGTLDTTFNPGAGGTLWAMRVEALAVQTDGKILVGGQFNLLAGQARDKIGRLNPDGSLDTAFNPGANNWVDALVILGDGKILVSGAFDMLGGQTRHGIGRLNVDGSLDTTFEPETSGEINEFAVQSDGKILIAGGGYYLSRLNTDGTKDNSFTPAWEQNSEVKSMAVQPDGKILVGGWITTTGDPIQLGRLNTDGSVDTLFNPVFYAGKSYVYIFSLKLQPNAKILVGGIFYSVNGEMRMNLARLKVDGTLDAPLP